MDATDILVAGITFSKEDDTDASGSTSTVDGRTADDIAALVAPTFRAGS